MDKRCPSCEESKPLEAFYVNADGHIRSWCKDCEAARRRARYAANPEARERAITYAIRYQAEHPEQREKKRAWEAANREKRRAQRLARTEPDAARRRQP